MVTSPHGFSEQPTAAWQSESIAGIAPGRRGPDVAPPNPEGKFGRFCDRFTGTLRVLFFDPANADAARELLGFMNRVVADDPDRNIHVIRDNLNGHKPKRDCWLARHPNAPFHFTPADASWLDQVEVWFSALVRAALKGASFTGPPRSERLSTPSFETAIQPPFPSNGMPKPSIRQSSIPVIAICASEY